MNELSGMCGCGFGRARHARNATGAATPLVRSTTTTGTRLIAGPRHGTAICAVDNDELNLDLDLGKKKKKKKKELDLSLDLAAVGSRSVGAAAAAAWRSGPTGAITPGG